jgi:Protein of unknown function (DUF1566)/PEP-CTERM motif
MALPRKLEFITTLDFWRGTMNTRHTLIALAILAATLLSTTTAHAALQSRLGGQAVYDTDLNITWLANANLAATNTFGVAGINPAGYMSWTTAESWIGAMNAADYLGYNNWELPTTLQPDATCGSQSSGVSSGYGCTGSMMGTLFYTEIGGVSGSSITTTHNANYSLFNNVQAEYYWSGTTYAPLTTYAWYFTLGNGYQDRSNKTTTTTFYAWAVLPGDVAAVPEPETYAMFLAGLGLLGVAVQRQRESMPLV